MLAEEEEKFRPEAIGLMEHFGRFQQKNVVCGDRKFSAGRIKVVCSSANGGLPCNNRQN